MSWWRWLISSLRTTLSCIVLCWVLGGYGVDLAWAPDVDGAGFILGFLGMVPVYPVGGRMIGLLCGVVIADAAATATAVAFSSLSFLIIKVLLW
jgi:hypothetical protein